MSDTVKVLAIGMMSSYGGIESFLINVFRRINKQKVRLDFLSFSPKCAYEDEIVAAGGTVFHITRRGKNPFKNRVELKEFFKAHKNDYDYVWVQLSSASNITSNIMARKYSNAKIISHSHSTSFESSKIAKPFHCFLNRSNRKKFVRCTDYCFACSKAAGDYLFYDFDQPVKIVNNGIDVVSYRFDSVVRAEIRNELGITDETTVIGHAGRLCAIKNQDFIIDVFNNYCKTNKNTELIIAGEGALKTQLEDHANSLGIGNKVHLIGYRKDFNRLIQAFDLLILPSFSEGFSMTLIEAQSSGLPCLVSDTISKEVGITELVHYESLNASSEKWSQDIFKILNSEIDSRNSTDYVSEIISAGFDSQDAVSDLERFFLRK